MTTPSDNVDLAVQKRSNRLWRWILLCSLLVCLTTVLCCSAFATRKIKETLEASGYWEAWEEGVDGETVADVPYGEKNWNKIDVFYPKELSPEKSRAAFVYIHGGAWVGGDRGDMRAFARRATKAGYVSASVGYTLYKEGLTDSYYSIFVVLDEIDAALAKLKETAAERGIELDRVALGGDSAGGHIISLYAYSRGKNAPLPVVFLAPRVAPIDFHADAWAPILKAKDVGRLVSAMNHSDAVLTAEQIESPDEKTGALIDAVSPLSYLTRETAIPTVAAYGGKDPLVGTRHCAKIRERMKSLEAKGFDEAGEDDVVFDGLEYPHSGHMLESDPDCAKRFQELVLKYAARYLDEPVATNEDEPTP